MKSLANKESEIYFDCGSRVKEIRKDLKLSVGEFIELINYSSEKNWLEIEKGKKELGISFLEKIHQITGASLDWLKYGKPKQSISNLRAFKFSL